MRGPPRRFTQVPTERRSRENGAVILRAIHILHNGPAKPFSFPIVSNTLRGELFRKTVRRRRGGSAPWTWHFRSIKCRCNIGQNEITPGRFYLTVVGRQQNWTAPLREG